MTPLIAEFIKFAPDPAQHHWFDVGDLPRDAEFVADEELMHLPFDDTVIVGRDSDGSKFMIRLINDGFTVSAGGMLFTGPYPAYIKPFSYINTPEGLRVYGRETPKREQYMPIVAIIGVFLAGLRKPTTAYIPTSRKSLINSKRAAKGKGPVLFDWHTVEVAPIAPKAPHLGGTHASPRLHDRRGHWRNTRSGKRVWVRDCKVGDPSKGIIFKDYKVAA